VAYNIRGETIGGSPNADRLNERDGRIHGFVPLICCFCLCLPRVEVLPITHKSMWRGINENCNFLAPVNLYNGQAQKSVLQCNSNGHMQCAPTMGAQIKLPERAHAMCPYDGCQIKLFERAYAMCPYDGRLNKIIRTGICNVPVRWAPNKIIRTGTCNVSLRWVLNKIIRTGTCNVSLRWVPNKIIRRGTLHVPRRLKLWACTCIALKNLMSISLP